MSGYSPIKKGMLAVGILLIIVGIVILIYGFINFGSLFGGTSESFAEFGSRGFSSIVFFVIGGFCLVIGIGLTYISQIRRVASYIATETSPAITTASHALGKGLGTGIKESTVVSSDQKEIIKIKCPHCGYLESEDAEFCSKCGNKM